MPLYSVTYLTITLCSAHTIDTGDEPTLENLNDHTENLPTNTPIAILEDEIHDTPASATLRVPRCQPCVATHGALAFDSDRPRQQTLPNAAWTAGGENGAANASR